LPILFVQHDGPKGHPLEVNTVGWAIHASVLPRDGEPVIHKRASDSFFETSLAEELERRGIGRLIITGGMSEYCVDTTCRRAVTMGYDVTLVADGHLTRDTPELTAAQVIGHHNLLLDGFSAGGHSIQVKPAAEVFL
jgi:nicotinamidase-related amidase